MSWDFFIQGASLWSAEEAEHGDGATSVAAEFKPLQDILSEARGGWIPPDSTMVIFSGFMGRFHGNITPYSSKHLLRLYLELFFGI